MTRTNTVSDQNWNNRCKTVATKNLKRWRRTPDWLCIMRQLRQCIIEIDLDDGITYDVRKYEKIRAYLLTEHYALTGEDYCEEVEH